MNRLLIVDDVQLICSSLTKKVEEYSDAIVVSGTAANGKQALDWLSENYADICITDVRMPVMDGIELIKNIRDKYPWMVYIIVSSYDDFSYAKKGIELMALDYILKPVDTNNLYEGLKRAELKIQENRSNLASYIILRNFPQHKVVMDKWIECLKLDKFESWPTLVVDTLEMLEKLAEDKRYLLSSLSMEWLYMVTEELKKERLNFSLHEGKDLGLGQEVIRLEEMNQYFRLCAIRRLEEGIHHIFNVVKGARENPTSKLVGEIKKYINEHFMEKGLTLQGLADTVGVSKNYMSNLFKQETGITVWNYVVAARMNMARELLKNTLLKNYEIADQVGYEDSVHFSQLFKESYGMTPNEYKKRMK
jgi:two-component system, response regulator YesN